MMYKRLLSLIVVLFIAMNIAYAQEEHWMPDLALREAVREKLGVPADTPLNLAYVQLHLTELIATDKGIVDLTGLEYATDLQVLALLRNEIHDISPLSGLTGLVFLDLAANQISDLRPLAGLTRVEELKLSGNQITDVSPLAGLVNLKRLNISNNPIADILPLMGLENLEDLRIRDLDRDVFFTIPIPKLIQFGYDESCDLEGIPISERVKNREYPSVFSAWGNIINLPSLSWREKLAYHDLFFSSLPFNSMKWVPSPEGLKTFVHVESAKGEWEDSLSLNPNMLFIVGMNYWAANPGEYPDDWPYWARDELGNIIQAEDHGTLLIDFTYPGYQDYMVRRAVQFAKCGLFDGIFFDVWRDEWRNRGIAPYYAYDLEEAAITMLRRIREGVDAVRDNFLIIVNTNDTKIPHSAPYVNGMFMETIGPYHRQHLTEIESTLLWGEQNLREPKINCLEGWAIKSEPLDSPKNQQRMRLFTTMSLALSDGYVLFSDTYVNFHNHYWYPFWDADLGRPVGGDETKGQLYKNRKDVPIEGVFIREYTNGWAVYNRSGKERKIYLPETVSAVASGVKNKHWHTVPDLDGEIYLKQTTSTPQPDIGAKNRYDVDEDGDVDITDVKLVVLALGQKDKNITNPRTDVNKNKKVDKNDVLLVIDNLDDANGAPLNTDQFSPISEETMQLLNPTILHSTLKALRLENDGSLKYQQAIAYLENLLAAIRPDATQLLANYPNPFNPETWIPYHLANPSNVQITIYDTRGSIVRQLNLGHQREDYYTSRSRAAYWDGRNAVGERVASGVYFYQLKADNLSLLRKMLILK